jgi:hypothetical protein
VVPVADGLPENTFGTQAGLECDLDGTNSFMLETFSEDATFSGNHPDLTLSDDDCCEVTLHGISPILDGDEIVEAEDVNLHFAEPYFNVITDLVLPTCKQNLVSGNDMVGVSMLVA